MEWEGGERGDEWEAGSRVSGGERKRSAER